MNFSSATRYASGIHFHKNKLNLLLWFEKIVLPEELIGGSGLDKKWYTLLRDSGIFVSDKELRMQGLLKTERIFGGQRGNQEVPFGGSVTFNIKSKTYTSWSTKKFCEYLRQAGLIAPSIYETEPDFSNGYNTGTNVCLGVILKNLPEINFEKTDFRQFYNFITNDETIKLRRRLFNWQNEIEKNKMSTNEIQELIATRLDDYKTWIDTVNMKHETNNFETVLVITAEVIENLLCLKPSKAVKALFDFRKRELDLTLGELQAPGRELAFIHHVLEEFSNE